MANGIPIVSHSNSFLTPPYDGTGANARAVDRAAAAGVLWINSAGNYAERHWAGRPDAGDALLPLAPTAGTPLSFTLAWRGAGAHATLTVQRQADGTWVTQATSVPDPDDPTAPGAVTPTVVADAVPWRLVVHRSAGALADLEVFSRTVGFGPLAVPAGSVPEPGDAAGAIAVGAVPWLGDTLAGYSSQGPTDDGRLKPDIVAPTYITSNPAFPGTAGTSAATPHVAAAAALLRQERQAAGLPVDTACSGPPSSGRRSTSERQALTRSSAPGWSGLDTTPPRVRLLVGPGQRPLVRVRARRRRGGRGPGERSAGARSRPGPARDALPPPRSGTRRQRLVVSVRGRVGRVRRGVALGRGDGLVRRTLAIGLAGAGLLALAPLAAAAPGRSP